MKKIIVTLLATFVAASALAQGTVKFANTTSTKLTKAGAPTDVAGEFTVGLYWAAGADQPVESLALADGGTALNQGAVPVSVLAGLFNGGNPFAIQGAGQNEMITVEVRAWDTASGMFAGAAWQGRSGPLNVQTGGGATAPGNLFPPLGGIDIQLAIVPEPTSMALAGLGAAALLVFRRRK
jgi:hypothetical protein